MIRKDYVKYSLQNKLCAYTQGTMHQRIVHLTNKLFPPVRIYTHAYIYSLVKMSHGQDVLIRMRIQLFWRRVGSCWSADGP